MMGNGWHSGFLTSGRRIDEIPLGHGAYYRLIDGVPGPLRMPGPWQEAEGTAYRIACRLFRDREARRIHARLLSHLANAPDAAIPLAAAGDVADVRAAIARDRARRRAIEAHYAADVARLTRPIAAD
jgi:hypothetical protein